jgi:hypothetical protein
MVFGGAGAAAGSTTFTGPLGLPHWRNAGNCTVSTTRWAPALVLESFALEGAPFVGIGVGLCEAGDAAPGTSAATVSTSAPARPRFPATRMSEWYCVPAAMERIACNACWP